MRLTPEIKRLFENLGPGDIVFDCGAHGGWGTQKLADLGPTIYAFEPNPNLFQLLKNRFINHQNVICINKGVWIRNDRMRLYIYPPLDNDTFGHGYASSIIEDNLIVDPNLYIDIEVIDLTEFIQGIPGRIKLLLMDIEGAEFEILEKMIGMDLHTVFDNIVVVTHEWMIPGMEQKADHLRKVIQEKGIVNIVLTSI